MASRDWVALRWAPLLWAAVIVLKKLEL